MLRDRRNQERGRAPCGALGMGCIWPGIGDATQFVHGPGPARWMNRWASWMRPKRASEQPSQPRDGLSVVSADTARTKNLRARSAFPAVSRYDPISRNAYTFSGP